MDTRNRTVQALLAVALATIILPASAFAQATAVGKVVALEGTATVARASLEQPAPLSFKDNIFVQDRVATGEKSITRILLGGKASVTVREHSVLHITEVPWTSTVNLEKGRISVAVSKDKMKPGETVEIRTPNAIAAIRGTVVVAEVEGGYNGKATITVLRGVIDVVKIDSATGKAMGPAVPVLALQSVTVTGAAPVPPAAPIKPENAQQLTSDFNVIPTSLPRASLVPIVEAQMEQAKQEVAAPAPGKGREKSKKDKRERALARKDRQNGSNDGENGNGVPNGGSGGDAGGAPSASSASNTGGRSSGSGNGGSPNGGGAAMASLAGSSGGGGSPSASAPAAAAVSAALVSGNAGDRQNRRPREHGGR